MPPRNRMLSRGWRTMISPKTPAAEDRFLHVMQIGEPSAPKLPAELFESGTRIGVKVADRIVTFSKNGRATADPVEFTVPAGAPRQALLTDLLPGDYTVMRDGKPERNITVTEGAGTLLLPVEAGRTYRVISACKSLDAAV